jgi:hypothetical protein
MPKQNVQRLVPLFGTSTEIARICGIDKAAVVRWRQKRRPLAVKYQKRILKEAEKRGLDLDVVSKHLGVPRCPHCGTYHIVE